MKVINTNTKEAIKTVIIAVLVTAIISFIGGMHYEHSNAQAISKAVKASYVQTQGKDQAGNN